MEPILILTDLDRTLIPNGHHAESPAARPIFRMLADDSDVILTYVSGRDLKLLQRAIEEYDLPVPDHAVTDVGTAMYRVTEDGWLRSAAWQDRVARDWQKDTDQKIITALLNITALTLQEPEKQGPYKISYYTGSSIDPEQLKHEVEDLLVDCPAKISMVHSIDEVGNIGLFDILPAEATKLHAVKFLIEELKIPEERAIYSGDSGNDLQILTSGIRSTLVANATPAVRRQALAAAPANSLYLAGRDFMAMNGNYSAGILEGLTHFLPETAEKIIYYSKKIRC